MLTGSRRTIKELNESFNFDWNDYRTIENNKPKIAEIELLFENMPALDALAKDDRQALGQLCFKLGSFYNHIKRTPDLALTKLSIAEELLTDHELAWTKNHIAFSFQQKLAAAKKEGNAEKIQENATLAMRICHQVIMQHAYLDNINAIKLRAFAYCVKALTEYELGQVDLAVDSYQAALNLYEKHDLLDDQYARAKNRYAQFLAEQKNYDAATKAFLELERYWILRPDKSNPYPARFYVSYADYLAKHNPENTGIILEKYKKAHDILLVTDGEQSPFTQEISKKVSDLQEKLSKNAFDSVLDNVIQQLILLPFEAREILLESFSTLLLRGFVPMSGMTVQQHIDADPLHLEQLNNLTHKSDAYKNDAEGRYVYQFAREATSAGIIPAYRDKGTGDIFVALICNKRNKDMYNWSAGYTEAPPPRWRGKLRSEAEQDLYYNPAKIKESATNTMKKALDAVAGDWTKVNYDYHQFAEAFKADDVMLPKMDFNSLHTASREAIEELDLDLRQFPQSKTFLISYDNTVGISQGDAPGQTSNRSHQYMVYLGEFDAPPAIKPGDDVAIADWVNVKDIQRKNALDYSANGKQLCIYMLRGLELGLKDLWQYLLQQVSTQTSRYGDKSMTRFTSPENVVAEIENFAAQHDITLKIPDIDRLLLILAGDLPDKTYTGKSAQSTLICLLKIAEYLTSPRLDSATFAREMTALLAPIAGPSTLYASSAKLLHFKPVAEKKNTDSIDPSVQRQHQLTR